MYTEECKVAMPEDAKSPVKSPEIMCDIVRDNNALANEILCHVRGIGAFLFGGVSESCETEKGPECMMEEIQQQQKTLKEVLDRLNAIRERLG
jgi:hypothetical protein